MFVALFRSLGGLLIVVSLLCAGCGDDRIATFPASGTVRFDDGQPVPHGVVEFRANETGITARGKLDEMGRFTLGTFAADDGAAAGQHRVIIVQHFSVPPRANNPPARGAPFQHDHDSQSGIRVAAEFADYATTRLRAKVLPDGNNEFELVVRRPPARSP